MNLPTIIPYTLLLSFLFIGEGFSQKELRDLQEVTYYGVNTIKDGDGNLTGYYMVFQYDKDAYKNRTFGFKFLDLNLEQVGIKNFESRLPANNAFVSENSIFYTKNLIKLLSIIPMDSDEIYNHKIGRWAPFILRDQHGGSVKVYGKGLLNIWGKKGVVLYKENGEEETILTFKAIDKEIGKRGSIRGATVFKNKLYLSVSTNKSGYLVIYNLDNNKIEQSIEVEKFNFLRIKNLSILNDGRIAFIAGGIGLIPTFEFFIYDPVTDIMTSKGLQLEKSTITGKNYRAANYAYYDSKILDDGRMVAFTYAKTNRFDSDESFRMADICMFDYDGVDKVKAKTLENLDFTVRGIVYSSMALNTYPMQFVSIDKNTNSVYAVLRTTSTPVFSEQNEDIIIYKWQDGKSTKITIPCNKDAKIVKVFEAKPGFYALFQYFEDERGMQFELKKIPQL